MATVSGIGNDAGAIQFTGLATGIDTQAIINGLTAFNNKAIQALQQRKDDIQHRQSLFSDLGAKLLDLQGKVTQLARSVAGAFDGHLVTSSDPATLTASASSTAAVGQYSLTVAALAQANQIASEGFADPGTNIKQGTLTLQVGNGSTTTVTIGPSNNTLQGLADAINSAGGDVRAAVVNDGTATPYRLLLSSTKTGAANVIHVTNGLVNGSGADITPDNTTVQAAADARVTIGSGSGAITVSRPTNTIDGLIAGVTIQVLQANPNQPVTLTVASDTAAATNAVQAFVDSYNAVIDEINKNDSYDAKTGQAGDLLGNFDVEQLRQRLGLLLTGSVPSLNASANRLASIGLTFTDSGDLQFDSSQLSDALNGKVAGVSANDVKRLFALSGASTNPRISFLLGGAKTQPTNGTPYQVDIAQAATQGAIVASNALADSTVIDGSNNVFTVTLDNRTSDPITLTPGTYSRAALAAAVQAAINANAALAGSQVIVDLSGSQLRITSQSFGHNSKVAIGTGSAISSGILGFTGTETGAGQDVAGDYVVNGNIEPAIGVGQILSGTPGNAHTDGLQVRVTLNPSQVVNGPDADLTVTSGLAEQLNRVLAQYLDPVSGRLHTIDQEFNKQAAVFDDDITRQNQILQDKIDALQTQFAAMETTVNQLKALSQQIAAQFPAVSSSTSKSA